MLNHTPILSLLGQQVSLQIDCPADPVHSPLNRGYLVSPNIPGQCVCVLGISQPLTSFTGQAIGVIRQNGEALLCVAPEGTVLHQAQIAQAFPDPPPTHTIDCLFRKSCGVLAYRTAANGREYLLVAQHPTNNWSLPKGHMEPGETEEQTALRELWEETGLTTRLEPGKIASASYPVSSFSKKQVILFTGEVSGIPTPRDKDIAGFRWVSAREISSYLLPDVARACAELI